MYPFLSSVASERQSTPSPFRIDEGFSEEIRSENGSPAPESMASYRSDGFEARRWLLAQPSSFRAAIVRELLSSLPNSTVSDIIHEANDRLHFDPAHCLPHEIITYIFEYLPSETLLNVAMVSKTWRELAMEPRLWRRLFGLEGWTYNRDNVRSFEENSRFQIEKIRSYPRFIQKPSDPNRDRRDVKRLRLDESTGHMEKDIRLWVEHASLKLPAERIGSAVPATDRSPSMWTQNKDEDSMVGDFGIAEDGLVGSFTRNMSEQAVCPLLQPSRLVDTVHESPRPNWHWIFKQRRRLEKNWNAGRFTNFRLPRLDHEEEGHIQCVYTLQFSPRHVVSGSRDQTVRVWDLETQRLKMAPLVGHSGSVLCLQFDERPDRDLIISGSSDADVMIWKFSTGQIIKRLHRAHAESVLNLRFDDRYLVTCSKDKTIKLWNMKELRPSDPEYPRRNTARNAFYPDHIINLAEMTGDPTLDLVDPLPLYSLIMTFEGHNAAVNAIQIFENHIVSASGDRKIILWDIQNGSLVRTFGGHLKGIACVQYDGRRIVSGSNDNSVRIFDSATGAEVARLEGHSHLVRTVQAEFGDMFDDSDALESEARENDRRILDDKAHRSSVVNLTTSSQRHFVFGAKLPPGGGGNKWSKIVSGSYDQSVIIWRRDYQGTWKISKQLRQEEALRATSGDSQDVNHGANQTSNTNTPEMVSVNNTDIVESSVPSIPNWATPGAIPPVTSPRSQEQNQSTMRSSPHRQQLQPQEASLLQNQTSPNEMAEAGPSNFNAAHVNTAASRHTHHDNANPLARYFHRQRNGPQATQQPQSHMPAHLHPQNPQFLYQPPPLNLPPIGHHRQHLHRTSTLPTPFGLQNNPLATALGEVSTEVSDRDASRVFRLQFDARRIISGSQLPVIVGWDFANGDRDIEEASQFFGEPA